MRRAISATRVLLRDGRIPRPLRGLAALALLPIPGPVDELALLLLVAALFVFYRESLTDAWKRAK